MSPQETSQDPMQALKAELLAELRNELSSSIGGVTKKYNAELAGLRKKIEPAQAAESKQEALTQDDLRAAMKVGSVMGRLEDAQREQLNAVLEGKSYREQQQILDAAMAIGGLSPQARGETPVKPQPSRAASPVVRDAVPRPETKRELLALKTTNPKQYQALLDDPDFDLPLV